MATHPIMRTPDGKWSVEVVTNRAGQVFRVKRRQVIGADGGTWPATGQVVRTVEELRELLGESYPRLEQDRRRFLWPADMADAHSEIDSGAWRPCSSSTGRGSTTRVVRPQRRPAR